MATLNARSTQQLWGHAVNMQLLKHVSRRHPSSPHTARVLLSAGFWGLASSVTLLVDPAGNSAQQSGGDDDEVMLS